jgi:hypothetical protein
MKSYLDRYQPRSAASPDEIRRLAAAAWHERHVLVVPLDDANILIDPIHRQACENVGNKLYGERNKS